MSAARPFVQLEVRHRQGRSERVQRPELGQTLRDARTLARPELTDQVLLACADLCELGVAAGCSKRRRS
jgi:hypothetical protein